MVKTGVAWHGRRPQRRRRPRSGAAPRFGGACFFQCALQLRLQQRLDIKLDENLVADDNAPVLQLAIPTDLEVMTVDAGFTREADPRNGAGVPRVGPIRRPPLAEVMHLQNHGSADATNGQLARYLVVASANALATPALKGDSGVLRDIKEITAA